MDNNEARFDEVFGAFQADSVDYDREPLAKIEQISADYAQPCRDCGDLPAFHIANFKDKAAHPNNVYICCSHCSHCDGKWYPDKETALKAWNEENMGSKPRDRSKKDHYDFVNEVMKDFHIPG